MEVQKGGFLTALNSRKTLLFPLRQAAWLSSASKIRKSNFLLLVAAIKTYKHLKGNLNASLLHVLSVHLK